MKVVLLEAQGTLQKEEGKAHESYMERTDVLSSGLSAACDGCRCGS